MRKAAAILLCCALGALTARGAAAAPPRFDKRDNV
jgi:hypothetical protein